MSFFLSSSSKTDNFDKKDDLERKSAAFSVNPTWYIQPADDDMSCQREVEIQRFNWKKFVGSKKISIWSKEMDWLWHRSSAVNTANGKSAKTSFFVLKKLKETLNPKTIARKELKKLIRDGVPPELRGDVWWRLSNGQAKKEDAEAHEQYDIVSSPKSLLTLKGTALAHDIEKDLNRTFPERVGYMAHFPLFVEKLRKVLSAYAIRNPKIGYCQSMNYVCALLLFHLEEEKAYWCFAATIEDIIPLNYYEPSLIGGRVDQQVFQSCIAARLPEVHAKFKETGTLLEPIICPWFMCLYINIVPTFTCCRIWDCLFWEGNIVMFRIGLTLMSSKMKEIIESQDFISIYGLLKKSGFPSFNLESSDKNDPDSEDAPGNISDAQHLIDSTFGAKWLKFVPINKITSLRTKFIEIMNRRHDEDDAYRAASNSTASTPKKVPVGRLAALSVVDNESSAEGVDVVIRADLEAEGERPLPSLIRPADNKHRRSVYMLSSLAEETDLRKLHEMAKTMDEGLSAHVEQFARELDTEDDGLDPSPTASPHPVLKSLSMSTDASESSNGDYEGDSS